MTPRAALIPHALRSGATLRVALLLACALGGAPGCRAPSPEAGAERWREELASWQHPAPLPSFPLVDQRGRAFSLGELRGRPLVVGFIFTRCQVAEACPLTMTRLKETRRLLGANGANGANGAGAANILVVTLDPEHDTPAVLADYARRHGVAFNEGDEDGDADAGGFVLATGSKEVVDALTSLFNVVALRRTGPDGGVDLSHPVKVALLDENLVPVREWRDNNFDPGEIVHASVGQ